MSKNQGPKNGPTVVGRAVVLRTPTKRSQIDISSHIVPRIISTLNLLEVNPEGTLKEP